MAISIVGADSSTVSKTSSLTQSAIPQMRWYLRYILGGTFIAGTGTDWAAQFEGKDFIPYFSFGGEIELGSTAEGYSLLTGFKAPHSCLCDLYIAFSGFQCQLNVNGAITAPASDTVSTITLLEGVNIVQLTLPSGSCTVRGSLPAKNPRVAFVAPFQSGADPALKP